MLFTVRCGVNEHDSTSEYAKPSTLGVFDKNFVLFRTSWNVFLVAPRDSLILRFPFRSKDGASGFPTLQQQIVGLITEKRLDLAEQ
jgi:hypothetical protein